MQLCVKTSCKLRASFLRKLTKKPMSNPKLTINIIYLKIILRKLNFPPVFTSIKYKSYALRPGLCAFLTKNKAWIKPKRKVQKLVTKELFKKASLEPSMK